MKNFRRTALCCAAVVVASQASARDIVEDFTDGMGNAMFDSELSYDFGTATDFTGFGDTSDLFVGELWLYADLVTVSVNSLMAGEHIESVTVEWVDFCGPACTEFTVTGMNGSASQFNAAVGASETWTLGMGDLGEPVVDFSLSSFEGRIDRITVTVVPAPAGLALLAPLGLGATRRRR